MKNKIKVHVLEIIKLFPLILFLCLCEFLQNHFLTGSDGLNLAFPPAVLAAIITAGAALAGTGVKAGVDSVTDCGSKCRAKCKDTTGAFFSGRNKCKKNCKNNCINTLSPQEKLAQRNLEEDQNRKAMYMYIVAGLFLIITVVLVLYYVFKKK